MRSRGVLPNGETIRRLRYLKGWSQEELAAESSCSKTTIVRLELGQQRVHLSTLRQVAQTLDVTVEALFSATLFATPPAAQHRAADMDQLRRSTRTEPEQSVLWHLTYRRNRNFVGREALLTALRNDWQAGQHTPQVLYGLGGAGKTQVALEYAYRHASDYTTVLWVQADTEVSLSNDYAALAEPLRLAERHALEPITAIAAVGHWLEQHTGWLLIFDQVEAAEYLEAFLPHHASGHVLITSRNVNWRGLARPFAVPLWTQDDAVQFLRQRTGNGNQAQAMRLATELGYLPLALEQAGAYIEATGITLDDYCARLVTHRPRLLDHGAPTDYGATVATTWDLSFEKIKHLSPDAMELLYHSIFLSPDGIPQEFLHEVQPQAMAFDRAIDALRRYSIMERAQDKTYRVHRLVQAVIRDQLNAETQADWLQTVVAHLTSMLLRVRHNGESWWVVARLLPHAIEVSGHLTALPPHVSLGQKELTFRLALGPVLTSIKGYAAPETRRNFERAHALCQQTPEASDRFATLCGLWNVAFVEARHDDAAEMSQQLLDLARQQPSSEWWIEAYFRRGCILWQQGRLADAKAVLERAWTLYDPNQHAVHTERFGQDPGVVLLFYLAMTTWLLGHVDEARHTLQTLLELAKTLGHPFNLVYALNGATVVESLCRDDRAMAVHHARAAALSVQHGFAKWEAEGWVYQGYIQLVQGQEIDASEGLGLMRRGVAAIQQAGVKISQSHVCALLAERLAAARQVCAGLRLVMERLNDINELENDYYSAELCRLKGELLLLQQPAPAAEAAESCFHHALAIAGRQGAKSWELRAAMSLSRSWQAQGKPTAAYDLLAPVYTSFTEGHDTADLQTARRQLESFRRDLSS